MPRRAHARRARQVVRKLRGTVLQLDDQLHKEFKRMASHE